MDSSSPVLCNWRTMLLRLSLFICLHVFLHPTYSNGQKTYMRTCDCEYMVNGKCAYTLLLPVPTGNGSAGSTSGACNAVPPTAQSPVSSSDIDAAMTSIRDLNRNISALNQWSVQNTQIVAQLQSIVIDMQQAALNKTCNNSNNNNNANNVSVTAISQLTETLRTQSADLIGVRTQLDAMQTRLDQQGANVASLLAAVQRNSTNSNSGSSDVTQLKAQIQQLSQWSCGTRSVMMTGSYKVAGAVFNVSSQFDQFHGAERAFIDNVGVNFPGAWCAAEPNSPYEWLQLDLATVRLVFGLITKGRQDYSQWVQTYKMQYVPATSSYGNTAFFTYTDVYGNDLEFIGNNDQTSSQINWLYQPIRTRYIRFVPLASQNNKCMRADVVGCVDPPVV